MNIVQDIFHVKTPAALKGSMDVAKKPVLTATGWLNRTYADSMEAYIKGSYGFRNVYIRLNSQIGFSVFKKAYANGVVIGKDNFLYEENYIRAYYGLDYIGQDSLNRQTEKLKYLQDTLHRLGCELLVVLNPGKASYFPEYIPDEMKAQPTDQTNMKGYEASLNRYHVRHIDFYKWFNEQKTKTKYPLFPKYGIHWSHYADYVVADSLAAYIEHLIHKHLPELKITSIETTTELRDRDNDIADGMNLLLGLKSFPMAYPSAETITDSATYKPNVLVISDSFYWGMISTGLAARYFDKNYFWYYNEERHSSRDEPMVRVSQLDLVSELKKQDVVIIMATESTLPNLGWGFIDQAYTAFAGPRNFAQASKKINSRLYYFDANYSNYESGYR